MANQEYDYLLAEDLEADKEERIAAAMRYYKVNKQVAAIMVETGYSKGTANRIINDKRRNEQRAKEREALAAMEAEKKPGSKKAAA